MDEEVEYNFNELERYIFLARGKKPEDAEEYLDEAEKRIIELKRIFKGE